MPNLRVFDPEILDKDNSAMRVSIISGGVGGGAVTVADGADVTQGATTDAAVSTDTTGTISGKLRGIVKLLASLISVAGNLKVSLVEDGGAVIGVDDNGSSLTVDSAQLPVAITAGGNLKVSLQEDGGAVIGVDDNGDSLTVDNNGTFVIQDSEKVVDNAAFTDGTSKVQPAGFVFDEVAGTALTENDAAAARIDAKRAQVLVIEDATTRGQRAVVTAAGALKIDGSAATQPVSGTVAATVTGTVTADAGTNLNTSLLALESGGHLATIDTNTGPLIAAGAGGYIRQDSTATIAKEAGGNLATLVTQTAPLNATQGVTATGATGPMVQALVDDGSSYTAGALRPFKVDTVGRLLITASTALDDLVWFDSQPAMLLGEVNGDAAFFDHGWL